VSPESILDYSLLPVSPESILDCSFGFPLALFISLPKTQYSIFSVILLSVRLMLGGSAYWWSFLKRVMCTKLDIYQFINVT